jgi:hypothetical protein
MEDSRDEILARLEDVSRSVEELRRRVAALELGSAPAPSQRASNVELFPSRADRPGRRRGGGCLRRGRESGPASWARLARPGRRVPASRPDRVGPAPRGVGAGPWHCLCGAMAVARVTEDSRETRLQPGSRGHRRTDHGSDAVRDDCHGFTSSPCAPRPAPSCSSPHSDSRSRGGRTRARSPGLSHWPRWP